MSSKRITVAAGIIAISSAASFALTSCGSNSSGGSAPAQPAPEAESLQPVGQTIGLRTIATQHGMSMQIAGDRSDSINPKLVYAFQGKGTTLTWDIGVAKASYERIAMLRAESNAQAMAAGDVVVTGNSSGALLAAWFSCRGFTGEAIQGAQSIVSGFPSELVKEDIAAKLREVLGAITSGKEFGSPLSTISPLVDEITLNGACVPRLPTVIVASNQDINDNRRWLTGNGDHARSFDISDFSYSQRASVLSFESQKVGKICTYFADPVMFRYLTENLTQEERLCDVRVMETADDMKLAVLASIAEPTYFIPIEEPSESKLVRFETPGVVKTRRFYNGGFAMPGVVQDVKRLFPAARALGTGRWDYSTAEVTIMHRWYDVNLNSLQENSRWWLDLESFPTDAQKAKLLSRPAGIDGAALAARYKEEIELGYQRGVACLQRGKVCLPARKTTFGRDTNKPAFTKPAGQPGGAEIITRQGLDPFLQ